MEGSGCWCWELKLNLCDGVFLGEREEIEGFDMLSSGVVELHVGCTCTRIESWMNHDGYIMNVFGGINGCDIFSAQYGPAQMRSFSIHHLSVATYNMIANNKKSTDENTTKYVDFSV